MRDKKEMKMRDKNKGRQLESRSILAIDRVLKHAKNETW